MALKVSQKRLTRKLKEETKTRRLRASMERPKVPPLPPRGTLRDVIVITPDSLMPNESASRPSTHNNTNRDVVIVPASPERDDCIEEATRRKLIVKKSKTTLHFASDGKKRTTTSITTRVDNDDSDFMSPKKDTRKRKYAEIATKPSSVEMVNILFRVLY